LSVVLVWLRVFETGERSRLQKGEPTFSADTGADTAIARVGASNINEKRISLLHFKPGLEPEAGALATGISLA
jgi:hypothetical protein